MEESKFNEDASTISAPAANITDHRMAPSRMLMLERRRRQFTLNNGIPSQVQPWQPDQIDVSRQNFFKNSAVVTVGVSFGIMIGNFVSNAVHQLSGWNICFKN